jgi:hypothetical protein
MVSAYTKFISIPFTDKNQLYTLERYYSNNAPYVAMIGAPVVETDIYLFHNLFKDPSGNLIPFRVISNDPSLASIPPSKTFPTRINILSDNADAVKTIPAFLVDWQEGGRSNLIVKPTPTSLGIVTGMPGTTGLIKSFELNNSPPPANQTPIPPTAVGGSGITTNYVPPELNTLGNGKLRPSDLLTLSFVRSQHQLFYSAAIAFELLVADAKAQGVLVPTKIDSSYVSYGDQLTQNIDRPSVYPEPGKSIFGWGLSLQFNKREPSFDRFKKWLMINAYKYNIYGLRADNRDQFYAKGFIDGIDNRWDYRGPIAFPA